MKGLKLISTLNFPLASSLSVRHNEPSIPLSILTQTTFHLIIHTPASSFALLCLLEEQTLGLCRQGRSLQFPKCNPISCAGLGDQGCPSVGIHFIKCLTRLAPYLCSESARQEQSHCNGVFSCVEGENGQNDISMSLCRKNIQKGLLSHVQTSFMSLWVHALSIHIKSLSFLVCTSHLCSCNVQSFFFPPHILSVSEIT